MRLLDTKSLNFREFPELPNEPYAILSHCWSTEEISYQQLPSHPFPDNPIGWQKIVESCRIAARRGLGLVWIDTCCIDKTNSAELSEAINSMYAWYNQAKECYAFLSNYVQKSPAITDTYDEELLDGIQSYVADVDTSAFAKDLWFTRGWTLQELLAPKDVLFFDQTRRFIGHRHSLSRQLARATAIDELLITGILPISHASIAQRMSWASRRKTSRIEDRAYSLLGIFNVNMPMIYGEGRRAFQRLQLEILKSSTDESILAWNVSRRPSSQYSPRLTRLLQRRDSFVASAMTGLLASDPYDFVGSSKVRPKEKVATAYESRLVVTQHNIQLQAKDNVAMNIYDRLLVRLTREASDLTEKDSEWVHSPYLLEFELDCKVTRAKFRPSIVIYLHQCDNYWYRAAAYYAAPRSSILDSLPRTVNTPFDASRGTPIDSKFSSTSPASRASAVTGDLSFFKNTVMRTPLSIRNLAGFIVFHILLAMNYKLKSTTGVQSIFTTVMVLCAILIVPEKNRPTITFFFLMWSGLFETAASMPAYLPKWPPCPDCASPPAISFFAFFFTYLSFVPLASALLTGFYERQGVR